MKSLPLRLLGLLLALALPSFARADATTAASPGPSSWVDPFIGVDGGGNVVPGPCLPFGLVKLSPDCNLDDSNSGYVTGQPVLGFSHVHVSGTGGGPKYGNILVMPTTGPVDPADHASPIAEERTAAGFYDGTLTRYGVQAALTATHRTGFHEYRFPATGEANVLIDAGSFLGQHCFISEQQELVGSEIRLCSDNAIEGYGRVRGGWNRGAAYTVYFRAVFDRAPIAHGTWRGSAVHRGGDHESDSGAPVGAWLTFDCREQPVVRVKVGLSYLGCLKAGENLAQENPGWDFAAVRRAAEQAWDAALAPVAIETGDPAARRALYTALYHSMLMPVDKTGENPRWRSDAPYYDDYYAIWDTFRTSSPLLTLMAESRQAAIVRALIDIAEHDGYLPDARSGDCNGSTQGGSNAAIVIADACAKNLPGIDYARALRAMLKDAEVPPGGDERKEGRGGLPDWEALGYISTRYERSGTRTLEYAANDWAVAQVARHLGESDVAQRYFARASHWKNLWRPIVSDGATGFIMPRRADGTWVEEMPKWSEQGTHLAPFTVLTAGSWPDVFYESHSWEYSFYVPHDLRALIEQCGGRDAFVARLDTFFAHGYYNVGNEPGFLTPMLYDYAGRPDRTAEASVRIRRAHFHATRDGLPGNDDSGAMSSLFVFHSLGIFPNAGQDVYLIGSPAFSRASVRMENGRTLEIVARGVSAENIYVQSATLNGRPLDHAWFRHGEIRDGATVELQMGPTPSAWGHDQPPPSMSDAAAKPQGPVTQ